MAWNWMPRMLVGVGGLVAVLVVGVIVAAASRSSHQPTAPRPAASVSASGAAASTAAAPVASTSAVDVATLTPDLVAAFPALAAARPITDPGRLAQLAKLRAALEKSRPDLTFAAPAGWVLRTVGDTDYAAVSLGPDRLCLVGFRPDGASFSGPACAPAAVAEQPTSPLTIYGHIDATRDGVAALVAVGVDQLTLRSEHGLIKADVAGGVAVATSNDPPLSVTVAAIDGRSVRRPLAADSGTAAVFYLSVLEGARRDALATAVSALNDALTNVPASGGLSLDNFQDRFIRVGVDTTASADQQAQLRAIVARFPNLAADVELVEMTTSANDLLQLMDEVQRAWGNDPSFVSIGIGVGVIDVEHRTGSELPAAVQAIIDKSPQLFHVTESDGAFSY